MLHPSGRVSDLQSHTARVHASSDRPWASPLGPCAGIFIHKQRHRFDDSHMDTNSTRLRRLYTSETVHAYALQGIFAQESLANLGPMRCLNQSQVQRTRRRSKADGLAMRRKRPELSKEGESLVASALRIQIISWYQRQYNVEVPGRMPKLRGKCSSFPLILQAIVDFE